MSIKLTEEETREAINVLYENSFAGFVISLVAASTMVFAFESKEITTQKLAWWIVFCLIIFLRFVDALYWRKKLLGTAFAVTFTYYRFFTFSSVTALFWASYVVLVLQEYHLPQIAFTMVVISGMAGGAATVLAGSSLVSMTYVGILLIPTSFYLFTFDNIFLRSASYVGIFFGVIMMYSARTSAVLTANTIRIKHQNSQLIDEMKLEQQEVKRINHELGVAYERINKANSSLEIEVVRRTEEIQRLSNLDPLTKLYNRTAFTSALAELLRENSETGSELAILFIDLDGFKQINDALGHDVGDEVLLQVSDRLWELKFDGYIGRWGGDEFILALPNLNEEQALSHSQKIIDSVVSTIKVGSLSLNVGASIGIALSPSHGLDALKIVQYADIAMYEHKREGGKKGFVFDPVLLVELQDKERMREGLRKAIKSNELRVVYQPIVSVNNGRVMGCEALLRWHHKGETLNPGVFLEVSEQSRLIVDLGRWVLQKACKDAAQWNFEHSCKVSVNVSVVQLFDDSFIDYLDEAIATSGLQPSLLTLEITESTFAKDKKHLQRLLDKIKDRGVELSIDDFGMGYSSMSQLQALPFDIIKVDKSFVDRIDIDHHKNHDASDKASGEAIIKATLFIAKELKCRSVAEGVETAEQAQRLRSLGADYLQGYYFSRPQYIDDLIPLIERGFGHLD